MKHEYLLGLGTRIFGWVWPINVGGGSLRRFKLYRFELPILDDLNGCHLASHLHGIAENTAGKQQFPRYVIDQVEGKEWPNEISVSQGFVVQHIADMHRNVLAATKLLTQVNLCSKIPRATILAQRIEW